MCCFVLIFALFVRSQTRHYVSKTFCSFPGQAQTPKKNVNDRQKGRTFEYVEGKEQLCHCKTPLQDQFSWFVVLKRMTGI
jgi:hypothetical protein